MKLPTRLLSAAAAALLLSLTAACDAGTSDGGDGRASAAQEQATGGGGTDTTDSQSSSGGGSDTSSGGADKGEICDKARQALTRFSDRAASAVGDHSVFNKAAEDLSAELKELSDQADGELKTTLAAMARSWGSLKIDTSDLTASANAMTEATKQISEQTRNLITACA
ncbi:MAG: hypothetical protein DIU60_008360 [Actinomycetes bacterium]|jgi:hypothetical protein|nr:MAG: hypothetical protein DIU60_13510 [Actinomycetota bacterium]